MKHLTFILLLVSVTQAKAQLTPLKKAALQEASKLQHQTHDVCQKIWDLSETALLETKSSELLINILQQEGFTIEKNIAGMPTAFVAKWGNGSPRVGILAEYDALPGTGNLSEPRRSPRTDGNTSGHGCGHNLFAAGSVNAAIAVKRTMQAKKIPGTLVLFGTPAEETLTGKVYMAKEGVFNNFDGILEWHPHIETKAGYEPTLAMNNFEVEFFGQSAHGSMDPWNGRSALDAVEMMNFGVNLMREHIHPTARIHYVIPNGGQAPNVIPEYAKVWYFVRDTTRDDVDRYYNRILKIAEGAAMATNTTHSVKLLSGVHQNNINGPILFAIQENLKAVGSPKFTDEEIKWAQELQKSTGKEPKGFFQGIKDVPQNWMKLLPAGGSTDVAEVSFVSPTAGFLVATSPIGVPWHSWATTASHGTPAAFKGADVAVKVLALTAIDIFTNEKLRKSAKQFFIEKTGGKPYKSPLPQDQKVTLPRATN